MLDKHLIYNTYPNVNNDNVILWKDYRICVLQDELFRIEKNVYKKFRDEATLTVFYRNMTEQTFTYVKSNQSLRVITKKCELVVNEKLANSYIILDGKKVIISNDENLLGTARTLDNYDGDTYLNEWNNNDLNIGSKLVIQNGVCSKSGVCYFDDAKTPTLGIDGMVKDEAGFGNDYYVFAYGNNYIGAVKALYLITGLPPLIPRFAFGNWWSRYHRYTDKEYLTILNKFEERNIPFTVATIDMDWHYSDIKEIKETFHLEELGRTDPLKYGTLSGWTGYSWNKKLFPDYQGFLKEIHKKNLKITLNLHPADGIRWFEDSYNEMAKAMGINPNDGYLIPFDFTNEKFINNYFKIIHKPYESSGVDFWWIDWQQGKKSLISNLDPLWSLNHYHYLDNALNNREPLILSRFAGIGSHRYPLGFSGDSFITWKTLAFLPEFTARSSNVGYTWWSHDIGGHQFGIKSGELFVRHLQFGVFSPINRLHCCSFETITKEPWTYGNGTGLIIEKYLRLRHEMIPYLYTANYYTHKEGIPLIEPLYYHLDTDKAYQYKNEYYFGSELIVAPIVVPVDFSGYAKVNVLLPNGRWTDIFTNDIYDVKASLQEFTLLRGIDSIPVLAKEGAIIPFSKDLGNSVNNPQILEILAYEGSSSYTLYEDLRSVNKNGELFINFKMENVLNKTYKVQTLTITAKGFFESSPSNRVIKVRFKNLPLGKINVYENDDEIDALVIMDYPCVKFNYNPEKVYRIVVKYKLQTEMEELISRSLRVLTEIEGINIDKKNLYDEITKAKNEEEYIKMVEKSLILAVGKERLLETRGKEDNEKGK